MKNLLFTAIALFYSLIAFSQQLPLKIVNNSSSPIPVSVSFYGDGALFPPDCDECHTSFSTDVFTIPAGGSILLDAFTDFNSSTPPTPPPTIIPGLFPTNIYIHGGSICSNPPWCTGTQAQGLCAFMATPLPIWTQIEFWSPNYHTKIGDQNAMGGCMPSTFWNDPNSTFTASWQIFSTQIVVLFDD